MLIPNEFQLGGLKWKVVRRKRLPGKYGDCNLRKQEIQILDSLTQEVKEQTFCHEAIHAILFAMGKDQEKHEEEYVDAFAMYLHQMLTSMK